QEADVPNKTFEADPPHLPSRSEQPESSCSEPQPESSHSEPQPESSRSEPTPESTRSEPQPESFRSEPQPESFRSEPWSPSSVKLSPVTEARKHKKSEVISSSPYKIQQEKENEEKNKKNKSKGVPKAKKMKRVYKKPKINNTKKIWRCGGCSEIYKEPIEEDWIACDKCKLPEAQGDRRGKHGNSKQLDRETIKQHVESFKPAIAHYRRAHAPNRRYFPSDLTATMMHTDFMEKNPNKVSYDLYRKILKKDMNKSFAQLGNEECEQCETFKLHQISCNNTEHCTDCTTYQNHREKFEKARTYCQQDVIQSMNSSGSSKCYYSADLQKVIMLPRPDMFKVVMFCPRLLAFNESFVPLGSSKEKSFAAVWHEAVSGRKQEDIISTYRSFSESKRDCGEVIVWTDNCTSQKKIGHFSLFWYRL
ncbi:hypothetical protein HF086_003219, partial [Spodoptera exigua]